MPNITSEATEAVRLWLRERDWDYQRLADECNSIRGLDPDDWAAGGVRNAVNGYDPVRRGRINRIALVTQTYPTPSFPHGLTYEALVGSARVTIGESKVSTTVSAGNQASPNVSAGAA
jgi:hypothetical protein